jgi:hypothetical protein
MRFSAILLSFFVAQTALAATHVSDLRLVPGVKMPNSAREGTEALRFPSLALKEEAEPQGFTDLLPFILRSPNQEDAGSCLYMSLTGIAEWWLAKLHPDLPRTPDGPIDLSERYLMNLAGQDEDQNGIPDWKTDSIYLFNQAGGAPLNRDYRFTRGWYTTDANGHYVEAASGAPGAEFGTPFNWIDERGKAGKLELVQLPVFKREVLFADPESNQWNTGVMPDDIADRIKTALREKQAPVQVVYNHYGYWHSVFIVGYDDELENGNCSFVTSFLNFMPGRASELRREADAETDPQRKAAAEEKATRYEKVTRQAQAAFQRIGCHPKGAFYVRDSIYGDPTGPVYEYVPGQKGQTAPYGKLTVVHEYDWVRVMANHATQILVE